MVYMDLDVQQRPSNLIKSFIHSLSAKWRPFCRGLCNAWHHVTGFEISLVRWSEMSKNDSRTSGIPAGLVRRTTAYFWFSHKLHWLYNILDKWMVHSDKWFLQSTCLMDKCIQFEISKPDVMTDLSFSNGQESYFYQLFIEKNEHLVHPSTQQLLDMSFLQSNIKLAEVRK